MKKTYLWGVFIIFGLCWVQACMEESPLESSSVVLDAEVEAMKGWFEQSYPEQTLNIDWTDCIVSNKEGVKMLQVRVNSAIGEYGMSGEAIGGKYRKKYLVTSTRLLIRKEKTADQPVARISSVIPAADYLESRHFRISELSSWNLCGLTGQVLVFTLDGKCRINCAYVNGECSDKMLFKVYLPKPGSRFDKPKTRGWEDSYDDYDDTIYDGGYLDEALVVGEGGEEDFETEFNDWVNSDPEVEEDNTPNDDEDIYHWEDNNELTDDAQADESSTTEIADKLYNSKSTLTQPQKELLDQALKDFTEHCPEFKKMYDRLVELGVKIIFELNPGRLQQVHGNAGYIDGKMMFFSENHIKKDYLQEEMLHAIQANDVYNQDYMVSARKNVEFEAKVFQDLIANREGGGSIGSMGQSDEFYERYGDWVRGSNPEDMDSFIRSFNEFCELWTGYSGTYESDFIPEMIKKYFK